jgi:hypothetical protein
MQAGRRKRLGVVELYTIHMRCAVSRFIAPSRHLATTWKLGNKRLRCERELWLESAF